MGEAPIPDDVMKVANECVAEFRWNNDNRWHMFVARAILADREAQAKRVERMPFQLAQLRHAYMQLKTGQVKNQASFADGLISPAIAAIEALLAKEGSDA